MELVKSWGRRNFQDTVLDGAGLLWQGLAVPAVASVLGLWVFPALFSAALPIQPQSFSLPSWVLFLLPLTVVDYLYYWNHRLLHSPKLWAFHRVHHTPHNLDIWVTSRNSMWTPLLLVYVWFHAFLIYTLSDANPYVWGMLVHGAFDLLRHSGLKTPQGLQFLGHIFILPEDHEWHHSRHKHGVNFGANLAIWDQLHGSLYRPGISPSQLGLEHRGALVDELIYPWKLKP